jgi:hypothetical protein
MTLTRYLQGLWREELLAATGLLADLKSPVLLAWLGQLLEHLQGAAYSCPTVSLGGGASRRLTSGPQAQGLICLVPFTYPYLTGTFS